MPCKYFQVYQTNIAEADYGVLVAPNDNRGNHHLLRQIGEGDYIFHYNSRTQQTFAVSTVSAYNYSNIRGFIEKLGFKAMGRPHGSLVAVIYLGEHLTHPDHGTTEHLIVKTSLIAKGDFGGNHISPRQVYLDVVPDEIAREILSRLKIN